MALRFRDFYKPKKKDAPEAGPEKPAPAKDDSKQAPPKAEPPASSPSAKSTEPVQSTPAKAASKKGAAAARKPAAPARSAADERNFAVFLVGREWFGIDLNSILEILHDFDIIPVPHLPAAFSGVTNLRGESLPVVDMKKLLKEAEVRSEIVSCLITIVGRTKIGFLVDSDVEIINADTGRIHPLPGSYDKDEAKFLESIFWYKEKFIGILKPEPTLEVLTEWRLENEEK